MRESSERQERSDKEVEFSGTKNLHKTDYLEEFMKDNSKYTF